MARRAVVRGSRVTIRNPWGAFGLAVVTFGIYYRYWYYEINRELNHYGRAGTEAGGRQPAGGQPSAWGMRGSPG